MNQISVATPYSSKIMLTYATIAAAKGGYANVSDVCFGKTLAAQLHAGWGHSIVPSYETLGAVVANAVGIVSEYWELSDLAEDCAKQDMLMAAVLELDELGREDWLN